MARLKLFLPLLMFVLLAVIFWQVLQDEDYDPSALPSALLDRPVPAFELPALLSERLISERDLTGQVVLLNVWATWCPSCRVEHPFLNRLAQQGVAIVGLNYKDESDAARQWLQNLGNPYRFVIVDADGRLGLDLGVYGAPETYVIDARGVVRFKHVGVVDAALWQQKLQPLLAQLQQEQAGLAGSTP